MKKCSGTCEKDLETNEVCKIFKSEVLSYISYIDTIRF